MAGEVQVFNHHQANLKVKERVSASGGVSQRTMITTTVVSEPIAVMLDEGAVAKRAAEMLAQRIREQTQAIAAQVKPATAKARRTVERAFSKGKAYALKRYAGGRIGVTPPVAGKDQAFNHSGRLAESIVARFIKSTKEWGINYAANRWNVNDFRSLADMQRAFQQWVSLVPVLQDASSDLGIQRAIRETFADVLQKQKMGADHNTAMKAGRMAVDALRSVSGALSGGGGTSADEENAA